MTPDKAWRTDESLFELAEEAGSLVRIGFAVIVAQNLLKNKTADVRQAMLGDSSIKYHTR